MSEKIFESEKSTRRPRLLSSAVSIVLVTLAPYGYGNELSVALDSTYVYDSNFFRSQVDEESEQSVEVGAELKLEHLGDRFNYLASYKGAYEKFKDNEDADAPAHRFRLEGTYGIDRLTTFGFRNNYRDLSNLRFSRDDVRDGDTGLVSNRDRYQRNDLELTLNRLMSRTWEVDVTFLHQIIDLERNVNRSDSESLELGARFLRRTAERHRLGGGVAWIGQDYDGADIRLDAEADYLVADFVWVFDIAEMSTLTVNGGPAWIDTEQDAPNFVQQTEFVGGTIDGELFRANIESCGIDQSLELRVASRCDFTTPGADPIPAETLGEVLEYGLQLGDEDLEHEEVTFFGGISFFSKLNDWNFELDLRREQSATSGDAIAASVSRFRWEVEYAPAGSTWDAYVAGSWERREAISDSTTIDYSVLDGPENAAQRSEAFGRVRDSDDRRDATTIILGARKRFTRSLSGSLGVRYRQSERRVSGQESDVDTYFFVAKISYAFNSINL